MTKTTQHKLQEMTTSKRGPGKATGAKTLVHAYKDYHEKSKGRGMLDQPRDVYQGVNRMFNEKLMQQFIIEEGNTFRLPHNLGELSVRKTKIKASLLNKLHVDWATSKKLGKRVYHLNAHTNGYKYFFSWRRRSIQGPCKNITKYKFIPTRFHKRELARQLKDTSNPVDYFLA